MSTNASVYNVKNAIREMALTDDFKTYIVANRESWSTFGKMDSHLYRKKLMDLMAAAKLTADQKLVVYFLFSVVKKKSRVMEGLNGLDDATKSKTWYDPVRTFIATTIVDYNTAAKSAGKFPGTHIPSTNPGLDLLLWRIMTPKESRTIEGFYARTTSVQMANDVAMQEKAKSGYKLYWDEVVKGTKNTATTEESKFREDYYLTSAGDAYKLLDESLKTIEPKNREVGYTEAEIKAWVAEGV